MKYILSACLLFWTLSLSAQTVPVEVTVNDLMKDMMQTRTEGKNTKIVMWFPQEFWDVTANADPSFKKSMVDLIKDAFSDYTIIIAVNALSEGGGDHAYPSYTELKKTIKLVDASYQDHLPIEDKDLSEIALKFKEALAPMFGKMLGDMGNHAYIFFFKTPNSNTNTASRNGSFKIILDKTTFQWSLPLPCLMPTKYCPVDNYKMQGNWLFCPFHGVKLDK